MKVITYDDVERFLMDVEKDEVAYQLLQNRVAGLKERSVGGELIVAIANMILDYQDENPGLVKVDNVLELAEVMMTW